MKTIQPLVGVGAVIIHQDKVLLVQRAKPPYPGEWAIPGGKVKSGETLKVAAEREIREETGLEIEAGNPVFTFEHIEKDDAGNVRYHYVVTDLVAKFLSGSASAQSDAQAVKWFDRDEIKQNTSINHITLKLLKELDFI